MRLKSLKLAGFKSFANTTTFTFSRDITAIVGPNGCGKSNVIDAIRWVLGESSAKQLRGGAMSDVIFAGTQDKSGKSVASVELIFEHTQDEQTGIRHEFNLYHELSVRRQVNLEGRSDYFINGTRARRRDVIDVFLGTGLGARSYAVIEQGMIGRIVDSNPMQLREFVEEAAGVSRYQARRAETQKKLAITQDNLARLHDVQSELVGQQKRLSKQAKSAEHFEALTLALADIEQQLSIQQLYQAKYKQQQQNSAHKKSAKVTTALQSSYDEQKAKQNLSAAQITQAQGLKDEAQRTHYQQQMSYQKTEYQLNDIQANIIQIEQQLISVEDQKTQAYAESETLKVEQGEQQQALAHLRPQLDELVAKRKSYKESERQLERVWTDAQDQLVHMQESKRTLEQRQAINNQARQRHKQSCDNWQHRQKNWQNLWQQLQQLLSASGNNEDFDAQNLQQTSKTQGAELSEQLQQIVRQQDSVDERLSDLQPQAHELQQRLNTQQRELSEHEKRHALLMGEYDTLHQVLTSSLRQSTSTQSVGDIPKTPIANTDDNDSSHEPLLISTIREQIELTSLGQRYACILDEWLALWLDSHVLLTDNRQALTHYLPELLTYQRGQAKGESGHSLWLTATQNDHKVDSPTSHLLDELSKKVIPLSKLIAQPMLALWQQCYLYIDTDNHIDTGKEKGATLAKIIDILPKSAKLLTIDGWIINHQGTIHLNRLIGAQDSENTSQFLTQRIEQRQRLEQLESLIEVSEAGIQTKRQTLNQTQRDYDVLMTNLEESRAQLTQLTQDAHHCQQQLTTERAKHDRLTADRQRLNNDKVSLEQEEQGLITEQKTLDDEQCDIQTALDKIIPKLATAKDHRHQVQADKNEHHQARRADDDSWQALQLEIQKTQMSLEHTHLGLSRASRLYDKSVREAQNLIAQQAKYQEQRDSVQAALQDLQALRDEQQALLVERETTLAALKQDYEQQQSELDTLQRHLKAQQETLAQLTTALALSAARLEDASIHTHNALEKYQSIMYKYQKEAAQIMRVSNLLADFIAHDRRVRPDKISDLQSEQAKLEHELSKIGAVNLAAISELAAVNERLEPLAQQTADIAASMQTLMDAITSIDETTKILFMKTLDAVNSELAKLFAKVFGGGQASLTLSLDDMPADTHKSEQWRAGLTLMAQPKGKRNSRLAVLSGGEKTLTALSLIFAIFKQHPAPFCVLDEVDAPLDDANVARFTSLILDLASDLQFIFISHNKLSMQIADELKGITMAQAGVSTLVSVSLDEAIEYIKN